MLGDIKPVLVGLATYLSLATCSQPVESNLPEIEIINRSLLISHVDVEGKEVDGGQGLPAKDLEERGQAVSIEIWMWRRRVHHRIRHNESDRTGRLLGRQDWDGI